jgi:Zn finger protein HypA/HybF involved in hydrogenase expression
MIENDQKKVTRLNRILYFFIDLSRILSVNCDTIIFICICSHTIIMEIQRVVLDCPKCAYNWVSKLVDGKVYYTCPKCHYQLRLPSTPQYLVKTEPTKREA